MKTIKDKQICEILDISTSLWSLYKTEKKNISYRMALKWQDRIGIDAGFVMERERSIVVGAITAFCLTRI